jgi:hypothetical protein
METNEPELPPMPAPTPQPMPQPQGVVLPPEALAYLRESGRWASFLSVMGFIFCGIFLVIALFIGTVFSYLGRVSPAYSNFPQGGFGLISVFYIAMDVLYFFFPFYLYRFADRVKKGVIFNDSFNVTEALSNLKSFFKLWGIVTIIFVGLYALVFIIIIIAAAAGGFRG